MRTRTRGVVLLVEDDPAIQDIVCTCLRTEGYRVAVASTFPQAVDALTHSRFGLVLADVVGVTAAHPQQDRWAILEHIRQLAGYTPVVILTTHRQSDFADLQARGFSDLLLKPFDLEELLAVVRGQLPPLD